MQTIQWTDDFLDRMREVGDEPADAAIRAIERAPDVARVLTELMRTRDVFDAKLPPEVHRYFVEAARLPAWARPRDVRIGEQLALEYGFTASTLLGCASLPECYVMRNGVHVLAFTHFLGEHTGRRVVQTAQMIMDVMRPGGLMPARGVGLGVRAAIKVRLMHAAIRHLILQEARGPQKLPSNAAEVFARQAWDPAFGHPINQEDMAYTLLTFSYVILRGLGQVVKLTREQRDAYVHCWNVVGHLMGVRDELLAQDYAEAEILFGIIKNRQKGETEAGKKLAASLMTLMTAIMPRGLKHLPHMLVHQYVDDETAAMLGIEPLRPLEELVRKVIHREWRKINGRAEQAYDKHPLACLATVWLHEKILQHWGGLHPDGGFDFPEEARAWVLPQLEALAAPAPAAGPQQRPSRVEPPEA